MLELVKEKGVETSVALSHISLTEWTALDCIGFKDLFRGDKITLTIPIGKTLSWLKKLAARDTRMPV